MRVDKYQELVDVSASPSFTAVDPQVLHCVLGCVTEAAELADIVKKKMFYSGEHFSAPIDLCDEDKDHIIEEMGDNLWYIAKLCNVLGVSMLTVMEGNIAKLRKRYPNQFTSYDAHHRDYEAERDAMKEVTDDSQKKDDT